MIHYRIATTAIPIVSLKTVFLDHVLDVCKQQARRWHYKDSERGENSHYFSHREGGREGEGVKITQVSKWPKSHYTMTW